MDSNIKLDISELDDYQASMFEFADREFPNVTVKFMKSEATKAKNKVKSAAKRKTKQRTGNYLNGFKAGKVVYKYGDAKYNIRVYNGAPHAHLIEYGHNVFVNGKLVGFAPGKHILENAMIEYQTKFYDDIEKRLIKMIEEALDK